MGTGAWGEFMNNLDRRTFLMSVGALSVLPATAMAQTACVTSGLPGFLPTRLTVDCASRRNFRLYRQNSVYMGLTGVVSMTFVRGRFGSYQAGNLFLFPWLKPKGIALGSTKVWGAVMPVNATQFMSATPVKGNGLPVDEAFCQSVIQAPTNQFIGCIVDTPYSPVESRFAWFTNVAKLADGKPVGIDWTSSNLNNPWFGGNQTVPDTNTCNGAAWRNLIVDGLNQASQAMC